MTKREVQDLVDKIGIAKATLAPQLEALKSLEAKLKAEGAGAYEGALFRATVSDVETSRLDMDAVRAKLSPQFIRANTTVSQSVKLLVKAKVLSVQKAA